MPREEPPIAEHLRPGTWALIVVLIAAMLVLLRSAWMADDAYITLRTVDHFVHGRGLTWNPGERVQAYTHPLWMLCLSAVYFITREGYYTPIFLSLLVSMSALFLLVRFSGRKHVLVGALILALISTRSFVDYSTSGLENPLSHALLIVFFGLFFRHHDDYPAKRLFQLALVAGLLMLTRMDNLLFVAPALTWRVIRELRVSRSFTTTAKPLFLGFIPFFAWEVFSLVYYGALVPNTALAKLTTGIPRSELIEQGGLYFLDALERDPLSLALILVPLVAVAVARRYSLFPIAFGSALYIGYTVFVGGDFMSGRFLTGPLLLGCLLLLRVLPADRSVASIVALVALGAGLLAQRPTLTSQELTVNKEQAKGSRGVADEQAFWFKNTGLLMASRARPLPRSKIRKEAARAKPNKTYEVGAAGMRGFYFPPDVFLLDHNALGDAFLARLPAREGKWRPGHFRRMVPRGYAKTLLSGKIRLRNKRLVPLYTDVRRVVRGPLFSTRRWQAIWRLNTGYYTLEAMGRALGVSEP